MHILKRYLAEMLIVFAFVLAGLSYALMAEHRFTAAIVLLPVSPERGLAGAGDLAGLASLAGVSMGGQSSQIAVSTLKSREYAAKFILENSLQEELTLAGRKQEGSLPSGGGQDAAGIYFAVDEFLSGRLSVAEDRRSGVVRVELEWTEPRTAYELLDLYVRGVNENLRRDAVEESKRKVKYMREYLQNEPQVALQAAASKILEAELQKEMMAGTMDDYALKVVDAGIVPGLRSWPPRTLIVLLSLLAGLAVAAGSILVRSLILDVRQKVAESAR